MLVDRRIIVGFGNAARADDGVGLKIVERIAEKGLDNSFEAVEIGNDGMKLLAILIGNDVGKLLIIDCARMRLEPGDFRIFSPEQVESRKEISGVTTHEGDVLKVLEMGRQLGIRIPEVKIMAIEPESMELEMDLSPALSARLDKYVAAAAEEITAGQVELPQAG